MRSYFASSNKITLINYIWSLKITPDPVHVKEKIREISKELEERGKLSPEEKIILRNLDDIDPDKIKVRVGVL